MAYVTNSAANPDQLLSDLKDFLFANGWTINRWDVIDHTYTKGGMPAEINGLGAQLCVQKQNSRGQNMFFNLRSCNRNFPLGNFRIGSTTYGGYNCGECVGLAMNSSTGYDAGLAWDLQPGYTSKTNGKSFGACASGIFNVCNYWFNQIGDTVNIVVEVSTNSFVHLQFGTLHSQVSNSNTGIFFSGSHASYNTQTDFYYGRCRAFGAPESPQSISSGAVYVSAVDGYTGWYPLNSAVFGDSSGETEMATYFRGGFVSPHQGAFAGDSNGEWGAFLGIAMEGGPHASSGMALMFPIYQLLRRASSPVSGFMAGHWTIFGYPDGVRCLNCDGLVAKSEFNLSSGLWKIFYSSSRELNTYIHGLPGIALLIS